MAAEQLAILRTGMVRPADGASSELRRRHFSILRQAITLHQGEEAEAGDDGLVVTFVSASAALSCAVSMQQGVAREQGQEQAAPGLSVGVSAGEVTRQGDEYLGDCVSEAAGLAAACEPGQVLATNLVRLMAGRRNPHECKSVGALVLEGIPEPVDAVEVTWTPPPSEAHRAGDAPRVPLPSRFARPVEGFVGRGDSLAQIEEAWSRVTAGSTREIVLISGEAGLGKTTLATRAAASAFEQEATVLFGHCEEELVTPYQLFAESLGHFVTHAPEDRLRAHVREHGAELARLAPALAGRIADLPPTTAKDADSERSLLFAAVLGMLAEASQDCPMVLLFDDIQWADKGSLLLLRHLAASDRPMRLMILATYRDNEVAPLLETLAALHRQTGVQRLQLEGLGDGEVRQFVEGLVGPAADENTLKIARAVHQETDGNPFFVRELLRHLKDAGAIAADGRWTAPGGIDTLSLPDSLREVVNARIARLDPECGRVLSMASVIGREFDFDLLARACDLDEGALLDLLDAARDTALIQELSDGAGRYQFSHALVQHAIYQNISSARRVIAHRRVGVALEDLCRARPERRLGELARHWCHAPSEDDVPKAIHYAFEAGCSALNALAAADAIDYFAAASALISEHGSADKELEIDLTIGLGTAQRQTGDAAFRATLLDACDRAAAHGDTDRLVRAALANDRGWHSTAGEADAEKVARLELALQGLASDAPERALVLGALCAELAFGSTLEHRQALADEAIALAEATGDDAIIVRTLNQMAFSLTVPSQLEASLKWTADALTRAERLADPLQLYFAAMYRATAAIRACDVAEADRCYAIAGQIVRQLDLPPLRWEYTFHMSKRAQLAGELDEAERLATEAAGIGAECGQPDAQMCVGVQLAAVNWMRGTMGFFAPMLETMMAANPGLPTIRASLAMAYGQARQYDDAARILDDFAATNYFLPQDTAWLNGMTEYADAAIACKEPRFAHALYDVLSPWKAQFSSAGGLTAEGPVCLYLGGLATVLERYDAADLHLYQAEEICKRNGMKFCLTQTQLRRGQMLMQRGAAGDRDEAKALLASAHEDALANSYGAIEREAGDLLGIA